MQSYELMTNLNVFKIYTCSLDNGRYTVTENTGIPFGIHPFVTDDESFILFNGRSDLYITFRLPDNKWSQPYNLGNQINTPEFNQTCPTLSPGKKNIFFSRYNDVNKKIDIYWVSSGIIDIIRKKSIN